MENIALIDVDSKIPNIALMKLSAWHKARGDKVGWWCGQLFNGYYDKAYASKIFDFSQMPEGMPENVEIGGSGYDLKKRLPPAIERLCPDYDLYPDCDYSIQRFHVGCIRKCDFCIVNQKEGNIKPVKPMELNPKGKYIRVIDNNFFSNPRWKDAIKYLQDKKQPICFDGIDARILTEEHARALNSFKLYKRIHMAWDNPDDHINWGQITTWIKAYKIMVYVLIGYNSTEEEDLYRVEMLREMKIDPFVMPYDKSDPYQRKFARWVNRKAIFKSVKWEDYSNKQKTRKR